MTLSCAAIDAMLKAGASAEMIASVVKAEIRDSEEKKAEQREKARQRKRKQRENEKSNKNNDHVTVTECDMRDKKEKEKSPPAPPLKEKQKNNPPNPLTGVTPQGADQTEKQVRGKSLSENWRPDEKTIQSLIAKGHSREFQREQFWRFQNHFLSTSTANGRKKDWNRAYANWITDPRNKQRNGYHSNGQRMASALDELERDIAGAQRGSGDVQGRFDPFEGTTIELERNGRGNSERREAGRTNGHADDADADGLFSSGGLR